MPSDRVHAEAEVLEHYISEDLEALIAAKLGEPSHDPHGNPIPGPDLVPPVVTEPPPSPPGATN
jgi:DtxR family Mn-dependent transcriptional regulator